MTALVLLALLFASGLFSGSETGVYSLSRVRLRADAEAGSRSAQLIQRLLRNEAGLLVTLLIANNLVLELIAHRTDHWLAARVDWPVWAVDVGVTLLLTPAVFFFGELLPKDLFRRRAHPCLSFVAPILSVFHVLFLPLSWPLERLSRVLHLLLGRGGGPLPRGGREEALEILQEGTLTGALPPEVEGLARNALKLRETSVTEVQIPWKEVHVFDRTRPEAEQREAVLDARYSRMPAVGEGGRVEGYVHQLEAFAQPEGALPVVRELAFFEPSLPLDRALARLRMSGRRVAVVGTPEHPLGLVTLTNLVDAIAVDLVGEARRRRARS
ncbi:MAG: CNNM domain-containing protein [Planctomycetota bacterium]